MAPQYPDGDNAERRIARRPLQGPPLVDWAPPETIGAMPGQNSAIVSHWNLLRHSKGILLLFLVAGALVGFLFSLPQTPTYSARSTIEVQNLNDNYLNLRGLEPIAINYAADSYVQTQLHVLQSDTLLGRVIERMKTKMGSEDKVILPSSRIRSWLAALGVKTPDSVSGPEQAIIEAAQSLSVRGSGLTRIIRIETESSDPKLAADFVNTLTQEYIEQSLQSRWNATQATGTWLTRQLTDLQIKLEKAEDELHRYASVAGLIFTSATENVADLKLKQIQEEYLRAQADRIGKQSRFEQASSSPPEALPEVLEDATLRNHQAKLSDLRREHAELISVLTPEHPKVERVEAQIAAMADILTKERTNILHRIRNEYEAASRREKLLGSAQAVQAKTVGEQAEKAVHYKILQREVESTRQLYESMLQKMKEAGVASAMSVSNIRVIDPAKAPKTPSKPNLAYTSMLGLLGGAFLGVAFVSMREKIDRRLKSPDDVRAYMNLPDLGVIPAASSDPATERLGSRWRKLMNRVRRSSSEGLQLSDAPDGDTEDRLELVLAQRPYSLMADAYRAALTSILFCEPRMRSRVMVFTSPSQSEGKSTTACNIALGLAEVGQRVLLIDADVRRPKLHNIFNVSNEVSLGELLKAQNEDDIADAAVSTLVRPTAYPGLHVLPTGSGWINAAGLLHSPKLEILLRKFRAEFDVILIDTAPALNLFDARVVARLADAVILVLRLGQTTKDSALAAIRRLSEDGTHVLGLILNDWDPNRSHQPYSSYYGNDIYLPRDSRASAQHGGA